MPWPQTPGRQPPLALGLRQATMISASLKLLRTVARLHSSPAAEKKLSSILTRTSVPKAGSKGGVITGHGIGHKIFHRAGLVFGRFRGVSQQAAAIEGQTGRQHKKGRETFHEFSWKGKAGIGPLLVSSGQADARDPASGVKRAGKLQIDEAFPHDSFRDMDGELLQVLRSERYKPVYGLPGHDEPAVQRQEKDRRADLV